MLACAALVLVTIPGLAFHHVGMSRNRDTSMTFHRHFVPLGVVTVVWILLGHSIAFSDSAAGGLFGDLKLVALRNLGESSSPAMHDVVPGVAIPTLAFVAYQLMFAIFASVLIVGTTAGRSRPLAWVTILAVWPLIVYAPIAHWLFDPEGWLVSRGAQDWAGGMVVHVSAGSAALALLLVAGRRVGGPHDAAVPRSVPLTMIGAGMLWFGWFGFTAGQGLQANGVAAQALVNTHVAAAAGMVIWLIVELVRKGRSTVVGGATGAVAALAAITPCAGYVDTVSALGIGAIAGFVCPFALRSKVFIRFGDVLGVVGALLVGGVLGSLLLGLFGEKARNAIGADGLFFGGGFALLRDQLLALVVVAGFSFVVTFALAFVAAKAARRLRLPDSVDEHRTPPSRIAQDPFS